MPSSPHDGCQLSAYKLYYNSPYNYTRKLELVVTLSLLLLTLIEEPAAFRFFPAQHHGYSHPQIWIAAAIEVLCVVGIAGFIYLRTRVTGWARWWKRRGNKLRAATLGMMVVDVVAGLSSEPYRHYRFLRMVRQGSKLLRRQRTEAGD